MSFKYGFIGICPICGKKIEGEKAYKYHVINKAMSLVADITTLLDDLSNFGVSVECRYNPVAMAHYFQLSGKAVDEYHEELSKRLMLGIDTQEICEHKENRL